MAVVLGGAVADALAASASGALGLEAGLGVARGRAPPPRAPPPGSVGGWLGDRWWNDDAYLGLLLAPLATARVSDRRFHDLPGRGGLNPWPAGAGSLVAHRVRTRAEFRALDAGAYACLLYTSPSPRD